MEDRKTPLHDMHIELGAKMTSFSSFQMPLSYSSIIDEHMMVRKSAGLFDISHMGEILVSGEKSKDWLNNIITNDLYGYDIDSALYTPMCYENGTTVDDLLVYVLAEDEYLLVVNASNIEKDYDWLIKHKVDGVKIENQSDSYAQLAVQGPKALEILEETLSLELYYIKTYDFENISINDEPAILSRTGYTGEDGFEIYVSPEFSVLLFKKILEIGGEDIMPIGLGARDTLRLEAGYPLYSHELSDKIMPREANLKKFIKQDKSFIGSEPNKTRTRKQIKFIMDSRRIPRNGDLVCLNDDKIGYVTSGSFSPVLNKPIGIAIIDEKTDTNEIEIEIRGKMQKAKTIKGRFFREE